MVEGRSCGSGMDCTSPARRPLAGSHPSHSAKSGAERAKARGESTTWGSVIRASASPRSVGKQLPDQSPDQTGIPHDRSPDPAANTPRDRHVAGEIHWVLVPRIGPQATDLRRAHHGQCQSRQPVTRHPLADAIATTTDTRCAPVRFSRIASRPKHKSPRRFLEPISGIRARTRRRCLKN